MEIARALTVMEKGFNVAAGIPFLSMMSSSLRCEVAKIQLLMGAGLVGFGLMGLLADEDLDQSRWEIMTGRGVQVLVHGLCNSIRGGVEHMIALTVWGSLVPLSVQLFTNQFEPIVKYEQ